MGKNNVNGTGKNRINIAEAINQAVEFPMQVMEQTLQSEIFPHLSEEKQVNLKDYIAQYQSMLEASLVMVGINLCLANKSKIHIIQKHIRDRMREMEQAVRDSGQEGLELVE